MKIFPAILLSPVVLFFLVGCATLSKEADLKESLRAAAERYWNLRLADKYEDTYKMEDENGIPPFEQYRQRAHAMKKFQIVSISVKSVNVDGNRGDAELEWTYMMPRISKPFHQNMKDEWVFKDGGWRHLFHQPTPST